MEYFRCLHNKGVVGLLQSNLFLEIVHVLNMLNTLMIMPHESVEHIDSVYCIMVNILTMLKFMMRVLPAGCETQVIDSKW